jgi:hypothetical protein
MTFSVKVMFILTSYKSQNQFYKQNQLYSKVTKHVKINFILSESITTLPIKCGTKHRNLIEFF